MVNVSIVRLMDVFTSPPLYLQLILCVLSLRPTPCYTKTILTQILEMSQQFSSFWTSD